MAGIGSWLQEHEQLFLQLGTVSLVLLAVTLVVLPIVVVTLPEDYFIRDKRAPAHRERKYPVFWGALSVFKNLVGLLLILAGLAMLVLPGQGLVTILIGLAMTNFPGKFTLERRIAGRPAVGQTLNTIRRLAGRPPLVMPTDAPEAPRQSG